MNIVGMNNPHVFYKTCPTFPHNFREPPLSS
jgi:hypothetical protein